MKTANGQQGVGVQAQRLINIAPADMDAGLVDTIEAATQNRGIPALRMPSGAGHDAMVLSRYVPTAMLFIPSIGGRSHDIIENTNDEDICLGANVLVDTIGLIAKKESLA